MNPTLNISDTTKLASLVLADNMESSAKAMSEEVNTLTSARINGEKLVDQSNLSAEILKQQVKSTVSTTPEVVSQHKADFEQASAYLGSEQFNTAMEMAHNQSPAFVMNLFDRGFSLFLMLQEVFEQMRDNLKSLTGSLVSLREKVSVAHRDNIVTKGREAMAMGISSAVLGATVSGIGTASLVKNTNAAKKDMVDLGNTLPQKKLTLDMNKSTLDAMPASDVNTRLEMKKSIANLEQDIASDNSRYDIARSKTDLNQVKGMAIQGAGQTVSGVIDGSTQAMNAQNQAAENLTETSMQTLTETQEKNEDLANQMREALQEALRSAVALTNAQSQLYSSVSSSIR
ncbi:hypothetical protein G7083_07170 [Vibrio sp. HDW18]|uniref:hypothetical protein n=1 Tax=Vibrio TaxID=662 RepID=UPI00140A6909|nr:MULTISPECIES: hypothetical protein [unclassified Vibrio]QIL85651.1 hypothetical protein G7083_07170 [Vibrio sp. HDW18]